MIYFILKDRIDNCIFVFSGIASCFGIHIISEKRTFILVGHKVIQKIIHFDVVFL